MYYMYVYLEPKWPLFLKINPPKQGLFQSKQPGHLSSRYIYTCIYTHTHTKKKCAYHRISSHIVYNLFIKKKASTSMEFEHGPFLDLKNHGNVTLRCNLLQTPNQHFWLVSMVVVPVFYWMASGWSRTYCPFTFKCVRCGVIHATWRTHKVKTKGEYSTRVRKPLNVLMNMPFYPRDEVKKPIHENLLSRWSKLQIKDLDAFDTYIYSGSTWIRTKRC